MNITQGPVRFMIYPINTVPLGTPKHKRRKLRSLGAQSVAVPVGRSVDLVEATGLTVEELRSQPELLAILNRGTRLRVLEAKAKVTAAQVAPLPPAIPEGVLRNLPKGAPPVLPKIYDSATVERMPEWMRDDAKAAAEANPERVVEPTPMPTPVPAPVPAPAEVEVRAEDNRDGEEVTSVETPPKSKAKSGKTGKSKKKG